MTDEEMAENYAKSIVIFDRDFHNERFAELEQAYLAGLKAGRPKWHNLQKDPTDVPKENVTVLLLTEVEPVTTRYDNEYESFFRLGDKDKLDYCVFIAPMSYIAWCEIPKYTEE